MLIDPATEAGIRRDLVALAVQSMSADYIHATSAAEIVARAEAFAAFVFQAEPKPSLAVAA